MSNFTQNLNALPIRQQHQINFKSDNDNPSQNSYVRLDNQYPSQNNQQMKLNKYKVYKHQPFSKQIPQYAIPVQLEQERIRVQSYANGGSSQILDQTAPGQNNMNNIHDKSNVAGQDEEQIAQSIRRERQRQVIITKIIRRFDEDGNGELDENELFTMASHTNTFSKLYNYLKGTKK
ncbi:unnamed protein product [Didymodactylos carnosus]|uniref:EF-hand domain-containing protein n=1 Tax=Didymodactylos carnosus TaxID=1234261 RepID=A0A814C5N5_9BILA|nr:unnamed protein product [Didymodactylos carnosus]CAF3713511.1 unnamed protein product [Didymodactylos carnosus]